MNGEKGNKGMDYLDVKRAIRIEKREREVRRRLHL